MRVSWGSSWERYYAAPSRISSSYSSWEYFQCADIYTHMHTYACVNIYICIYIYRYYLPLDISSFIFNYFDNCLHLYICILSTYCWKGAPHDKEKHEDRESETTGMTVKLCQKLIHKRFLISDLQPNGLAGGFALPRYRIATKFNKEAGKAVCYICPRKIG